MDGPLRVLVVISSPTDLEELDVEAEWGRIQEALGPRLADGVVAVDRLPEATLTELGRWLRRHPTHVIHFVGHGDFDERLGEGVVYFQDSRGRSKAVTSSVLGPFLRDHDPLRMVVLNACRSARSDMRDPFGGMAQGLVQQDATAVVAMQFPISDRAAVAFTGAFYGALVDGLPVDQASSSARKALLADFGDEWATPVLFLRAPDGDIFQQVHAPEEADDDTTVTDPVPERARESPPESAPEPAADPAPGPAPATRAPAEPGPTSTEPPSSRPRGFTYVHPPATAAPSAPGPAPTDPARSDPAPAPAARAPQPAYPAGPPPPGRPPTRPAPAPSPRGTGRRPGPMVLGLLAAGFVLVVLAGIGLVALLTGGDGPSVGSDASSTTLPTSAPLSPSQLLVAAGTGQRNQHIWLVDAEDPSAAVQLTRGGTREWIPVLSPDRATMIFARQRSDNQAAAELMVAAADGSGVRPFFDPDPPQECAGTVLRPAWFPDRDALVVPCTDAAGIAHLVVVDLQGQVTGTLDPSGDLGPIEAIGDPTISQDGTAVVVWAHSSAPAGGGSLYVVDVASGQWGLLGAGTGEEFSDPVFSEDGQHLAYRQDPGDGNYRVLVASITQSGLIEPTVVAADAGKDQDPMFSPDGSQVVYGHVDPGQNAQREELRIVGVTGGDFRTVPPPGGLDYLSVPAWSRR